MKTSSCCAAHCKALLDTTTVNAHRGNRHTFAQYTIEKTFALPQVNPKSGFSILKRSLSQVCPKVI
ncbi:MAG: hypothetical protein VX026_03475 [Myxococcota bacterium]|nr:hypothetical protein [Myxococcota bacterium]